LSYRPRELSFSVIGKGQKGLSRAARFGSFGGVP
jgi:hypothetical protein